MKGKWVWICTENWIKHMDDPVCFSFCIVVKNAGIRWSVYFSKFKDMGINFKWQNWFDCSWGSLLLLPFPVLNKSYRKILKLSTVNSVYCGFNVFVLCMCVSMHSWLQYSNRNDWMVFGPFGFTFIYSLLESLPCHILLVIIVHIQGCQCSL